MLWHLYDGVSLLSFDGKWLCQKAKRVDGVGGLRVATEKTLHQFE